MKLALSIILPWKLLDLKAIKAGSCGAGSGGGDLTIESVLFSVSGIYSF